jgi:hypothetical protein
VPFAELYTDVLICGFIIAIKILHDLFNITEQDHAHNRPKGGIGTDVLW